MIKTQISRQTSLWFLGTLALLIPGLCLAAAATIAAPQASSRPSNSAVPQTTATATPIPTSTCAAGWSLVSTPSIGNTLYDVDAVSANDIWAVGNGDAIHWDGIQWSVTPGGLGRGVAAVSANDVWSAGSIYNNGDLQLRIEHWDGTQWSVVPGPPLVGTSSSSLWGIDAASANDIWAVGTTDTSSGGARAMILHWDGTQWNVSPTPNTATFSSELVNVEVVSANNVWAVGIHDRNTLIMHWDGTQWSIVPSPNGGADNNYLRSIKAIAANDIWAVGNSDAEPYHALILHWDGNQWSLVPSPGFGNEVLFGVTAIAANDVWAVGSNFANNPHATITLHWDGTQWSIAPSPNAGTGDNILQSVAATSPNDMWAVGFGNGGLTEHYTSTCENPVTTSTTTPTLTPTPFPTCGPNSDYVITQSTGATIVPGTDQVLSGCDECSTTFTLPFTYTHYGQPFTSAIAGDNGTLGFLANANPAENNSCLPSASFDYAILPHWDTLDMRPFVCDGCGVFTSVSGSAPSRIFNIEWRACVKVSGICAGNVNFEVRLYEGQSRFDIVYGTVDQSGLRATIGTQRSTGASFTQFSCNTASLSSGLQLTFTQPTCPTSTPTNTPTVTPTPTRILVGHVTWQGRHAQPSLFQMLPLTLTLKSSATEVNFTQRTTDASGFFTVSVGSLPNGAYTWRVKGPNATTPYTDTNATTGFLANAGTITLTGSPATQQEMGLMRTADCNNDNLVTALDFNIVKPAFGRSTGDPGYDNRADFTGDQIITALDFNLIKQNFGLSGAP